MFDETDVFHAEPSESPERFEFGWLNAGELCSGGLRVQNGFMHGSVERHAHEVLVSWRHDLIQSGMDFDCLYGVGEDVEDFEMNGVAVDQDVSFEYRFLRHFVGSNGVVALDGVEDASDQGVQLCDGDASGGIELDFWIAQFGQVN